jgi:hypothetical protein
MHGLIVMEFSSQDNVLAMEVKNLLEFGNKFHNFRSSIKIPMNFYRFNHILERLKLTGKLGTRYIYPIFLESRTS